jgi:hypothetical protein
LSAEISGSRGFMAVVAASVASSVLAFVATLVFGFLSPTSNHSWIGDPGMIAATIAIVAIWAPAFALIPAGILGFLVERPKARAMIERRTGGFVPHLLLSVGAAALLSFLLRIVLHVANPMYPLVDVFSLGLFTLIGFCSGISWWFIVVLPGRRA